MFVPAEDYSSESTQPILHNNISKHSAKSLKARVLDCDKKF